MTAAAAVLPPAVTKEIRALFPTYAAALVTVVAASFGHSHTPIAIGLLAFAFGSVALGAQSFGHEYSHRTVGLLLSQPIDRRRLFLYKLAVLFVMLLTLTAVALLMFRDVLRLAASPHTTSSMLVLAAACGLFVAPWLTLVSRSTLAAVVFTIAVPGVLATASRPGGRRHLRPSQRRSGRSSQPPGLLARHVRDLRDRRGRQLADVHAARNDRRPRSRPAASRMARWLDPRRRPTHRHGHAIACGCS